MIAVLGGTGIYGGKDGAFEKTKATLQREFHASICGREKCDQNRVLVGKVREKCSLKFFVYVFEGRGREK